MIKRFILLVVLLVVGVKMYSQAPQYFQYQAIARNLQGEILANQNISYRISLLKDSINGTSVYSEIHNIVTNAFGLSNLQIGGGLIVSGVFSVINWGAGPYFVQIEMDESGGSTYNIMGVSQLLSVPYALYAEKVNPENVNGNLLFNTACYLSASITWLAVKYSQGFQWSTDYKKYSFLVSRDGYLHNFTVSQDNGGMPVGGIVDITILLNGNPTNLSITYTDADGPIIKSDTVNTVFVQKGDFIAFRYRSLGSALPTSPSPIFFQASLELK